MASGPREYDPEIKDIAEYVNKPVDSELAVSLQTPHSEGLKHNCFFPSQLNKK